MLKKPAVLKKVKFTVHTYPDLQPFLEMAIVLLGVYEHVQSAGSVIILLSSLYVNCLSYDQLVKISSEQNLYEKN